MIRRSHLHPASMRGRFLFAAVIAFLSCASIHLFPVSAQSPCSPIHTSCRSCPFLDTPIPEGV